ncbi:MAG: anhydro-N-acetylmuramic acid kinase [Gordonia sp. (in: high G+C Gram-positive bacteria)]
MRVLGLISGTSHDGIDSAIVDFTDTPDGRLTGRIEYHGSSAYHPQLRARLRAALPPAPVGFDVACELDTRIGQAFADAALAALATHARLTGVGPVDAICSHGQTVFHWVADGHSNGTLQLGQPAWIAEATGLPVISDVRTADIAAGGQGAPLVPILDRALLGPLSTSRQHPLGTATAALNLGGIANLTVGRPDAELTAWDIGPANALIDAVVTADATSTATFDRGGALAAGGKILPDLLAALLAEPYYRLPPPKSCGKELFHLGYVDAMLRRLRLEPVLADLVATLTELSAVTIADTLAAAGVRLCIASGGGVHNRVLMRRITELAPRLRLTTSDEFGIPADAKEAVAFALIGWATLHGLPANIPSCTGAAGPRILGRLTPPPSGAAPSGPATVLPTPLAAWPDVRFEQPDYGRSQ